MAQQFTLRLLGICLLFFLGSGCRQRNAPDREGDVSGEMPVTGSAAQSSDPAGSTEDLLQAALYGRADEVHLILQSGMDVNASDEEGHTPLMFAAFNGHASIVLSLLEKGAAVDHRDELGRTALLYGATGPFPETVKILLDHGADPNLVDTDEHFSPLMHAAAEGHLEVVRVLLEYGADPSLKDVDGDDAATFARQAGHSEVAEFLSRMP